MATILITGGSGLIGTHLTTVLQADGHHVRWLSREKGERHGIRAFAWDLAKGTLDEAALEGVDHLIHLAGAGIADERWSAARVKELTETRTLGPELLHRACVRSGQWPKSFISAAGIGYYGAVTRDHVYTEEDAPGTDTIAHISTAWERAADQWVANTRVVKLRTPVVLAKDVGALKALGTIARCGIASPLGSGKQYMPWVHIADLVQAYRMAVEDERLAGAYNVAAPHQPDNQEFMRTLARTFHRPFFLPSVPGFVLRAAVGGIADVLLNGSRVSSDRIQALGWAPRYNTLKEALSDLYR